MAARHVGKAVHLVVVSAALEALNKSDNERSGVLSTVMNFLGRYRDPRVAEVTSCCDWRSADPISGRPSGRALSGRVTLGNQSHQAADPADP